MTTERRQEIFNLLDAAWHDLCRAADMLSAENDSLHVLVAGAAEQVCDVQLSVQEDLPAPEDDEDPATALIELFTVPAHFSPAAPAAPEFQSWMVGGVDENGD